MIFFFFNPGGRVGVEEGYQGPAKPPTLHWSCIQRPLFRQDTTPDPRPHLSLQHKLLYCLCSRDTKKLKHHTYFVFLLKVVSCSLGNS